MRVRSWSNRPGPSTPLDERGTPRLVVDVCPELRSTVCGHPKGVRRDLKSDRWLRCSRNYVTTNLAAVDPHGSSTTSLANWGTLTSRLLPVALSTLPQIDRLVLATVTTVPAWHPQHDTFEPFPVHAWLIRHPDGAILVDTGVGVGNQVIDEWYHPLSTSLLDALAGVGVAPSDISAVVMSHLHFDHCGQQGALAAPVYVQATEYEAAQTPGYTVPDWAAIPSDRLRLVHGDQVIARGDLPLVHTRPYPRPSIGAAGSSG